MSVAFYWLAVTWFTLLTIQCGRAVVKTGDFFGFSPTPWVYLGVLAALAILSKHMGY